jgi:hypothetical protein
LAPEDPCNSACSAHAARAAPDPTGRRKRNHHDDTGVDYIQSQKWSEMTVRLEITVAERRFQRRVKRT